MNKNTIAKLKNMFDQILKNEESTGVEFCFARDLMKALGYNDWKNFIIVVDKAKISCKNSKAQVPSHFHDTTKIVKNDV